MSEAPTFREALERLEAIVRELERNDIDLDRALTLFEDGVRALKIARGLLAEGERKVKKVLLDADGTIATDDLDV
jgi:exodeoxyribonuclease VII small subunit